MPKPAAPNKGGWVECFYSCQVCGQSQVHFYAPTRREEQSVVDWMSCVVMRRAMEAHSLANLLCETEHLDLGFKMPKDAQYVGQATVIDGVDQADMTPEEIEQVKGILGDKA